VHDHGQRTLTGQREIVVLKPTPIAMPCDHYTPAHGDVINDGWGKKIEG
jgi:hypothetical protein